MYSIVFFTVKLILCGKIYSIGYSTLYSIMFINNVVKKGRKTNSFFGICVEYSVRYSLLFCVQCSIQYSIQYSVEYSVESIVRYNSQVAGKGLFLVE